jgi:hypothetical protein
VSLIGTLEKIELSRVLERIESHNKTGLLVIKPGGHWVELYFRAGRLMCIGPVRTQASLGERLFQEGLITVQALQEAAQVLGEEQFRETRMALTLMDMGYVSHEELRSWASRKAMEVLQVLFAWSSGEIYFDDDVQPPPDRLLVALSVSSLLSTMPAKRTSAVPSQPAAPGPLVTRDLQVSFGGVTSSPDIARYPTLMSATQFFDGAQASAQPVAPPSPIPASPAPPQVVATESLSPAFEAVFDSVFDVEEQPQSPETPMSEVVPPQHVDTTFMRPDMVMMPADLSAARDQSIQFLLTPEHWGLLTRIDGRTSLGAASYELQMPPEVICKLAGQLQALGLIQLSVPGQMPYNGELLPVSQGPASPELKSSYILPGYAAASPSPWSASLLASDNMARFPSASPSFSSPSFDGQAPWGNVSNGVTNMQGQAWSAAPSASQPMSTNGPFLNSNVYVHTK